ncbi:hypothetical protein ACWOAQ_06110 [Helcococcus kunzii]|nr:hypothetical protein [Helcococcus kunzii]QZO76009.1 hypothetical protein HIF96_06900 [Helcococcus kunzii]
MWNFCRRGVRDCGCEVCGWNGVIWGWGIPVGGGSDVSGVGPGKQTP